MANRAKIFLFVFVLVLLCFYISWKSFKSGNTMNTKYLNRILNDYVQSFSEATSRLWWRNLL